MRLLCSVYVLVGVFAGAAAAECLRYEPAQVTLTGVLLSQTFPGPPNFEDIVAGDQPEVALVLVLDEPICIIPDPSSELNSEGMSGIREVQLVGFRSQDRQLLDRRVKVRGTLFAAQTGHHHTRVLLTLLELRAA